MDKCILIEINEKNVVIVHNNYIFGYDRKVQRFKSVGLWWSNEWLVNRLKEHFKIKFDGIQKCAIEKTLCAIYKTWCAMDQTFCAIDKTWCVIYKTLCAIY